MKIITTIAGAHPQPTSAGALLHQAGTQFGQIGAEGAAFLAGCAVLAVAGVAAIVRLVAERRGLGR